jgi:hypothetical protein
MPHDLELTEVTEQHPVAVALTGDGAEDQAEAGAKRGGRKRRSA